MNSAQHIPHIPSNLPIKYISNWLIPNAVNSLMVELLNQIDWQTEEITMFGQKIIVPRKVAWFGDKNALYRYSGVDHHPLPWLMPLEKIQKKLAQDHKIDTNSVLCNFYQNGQDYMGWHRDREKELGENPIIASISLGASRKFMFRNRLTKETYSMMLNSGSLLIMERGCQDQWHHSLPKMARIQEPRINLTFRKILHI